MAEHWVSTQAGRHLSGRRKTSTQPEVLQRKALHAAGGRFRLHRTLAKGCTPDIIFPGRHLAVFVDGCFWTRLSHARAQDALDGAERFALGREDAQE